jgi:hypothetical protein
VEVIKGVDQEKYKFDKEPAGWTAKEHIHDPEKVHAQAIHGKSTSIGCVYLHVVTTPFLACR